jgi:hypothetical protein
MSKQPAATSYRELIQSAFDACDLKVPVGWHLYVMEGGTEGIDAFRYWVSGKSEPRATDYSLLASALNKRLVSLGKKKAMLPELPLLGGGRPDPLKVIEGGRRTPKNRSSLRSSGHTAWFAQTLPDQGKEVA